MKTKSHVSDDAAAEAPPVRSLKGARATRIIEAMRESVTEVGVAGSTFERVAAKAGVSRGLLHYYFGTKERLLIEVIRRDTELRVQSLVDALAGARSVDELIAILVSAFEEAFGERQGHTYNMSELFVAGRHQPEIRRELGELFNRTRGELADVLRVKESEGVLRLRFDAEAVVTYLMAAGDGGIFQRITQPERDFSEADATGVEVARWLFCAE